MDSNEQREIDTLLKATRNLDLVANSDNNEEDDQRYLFVNKNRVTEQDLDSVLAREYAEDQIGEVSFFLQWIFVFGLKGLKSNGIIFVHGISHITLVIYFAFSWMKMMKKCLKRLAIILIILIISWMNLP